MFHCWHRFATGALGALLASAITITAAAPAKLTIMHINDVYEISPAGGRGGFAEVMTLIREERGRADASLLTFGGDLLSPSVLSGLTQGEQMIALMNAIGVDVGVYGNHEFDFGPDLLAERVGDSNFPWVVTNVLGADGKPFGGAVASWTTEVGEYTVGVFGLLTPETDVLSSPGQGVTFAPYLDAASAAVGQLREQGADVVIALTHLTVAEDRALARVGGINLILGGHDHDPISYLENGVLILKAGSDAHFLGVVDLVIDTVESRGGPRVVTYPQWRFRSTRGVAADAQVGALVDKYNAELDEALDVPVGPTEVALDSQRSSVRSMETNMGNLIADAIREAVDADVGLTNGGGIRGNKVYEPGAMLTRKDVLTELPFGNVAVLVEISGADLRAALENGVSQVEDGAGRFPQVSGLRFSFDPAKPAGGRVGDVSVGGQPLDPAKRYKVATNDYMLGGGDGYASFANGTVLIDASGATLMATVVMDYIAQQGGAKTQVEGRITTP